ncbi:Aldehyde dehydrogenase (EC [Lentimonas sp. CC19]|nr:Aldehyde dehydrogenase (EC [Lentimonas sp. CC4]CAA6683605.1 Aldehyde dehydrogenase (EC [Lentimonas sp. CC6]CAA6690683.1 Aldehyde dehydrogenase (EC [Lentimonas sp. CC19]CAA6693390.1 Aldehyde dehydrogenase (EC [Lentimonas sp. CC10]CAA7071853.1 Aldehyde dehydrogenase (EC [Lentimonas sp. CC11]CAA7170114.1 Aldehyde dehydrogenase (EC [Lentimonas sp. CC21]CAA7182495.1 Aldehyde dehydrogenase (EC [Lentimonas sp. CC8]
MLINGQSVTTETTIDVINPSTEEVLGMVPAINEALIQDSLDAAQSGFQVWSKMTPAERKTIILRYAELLDANRERIVTLLMAETGKTREIAEYDFDMLPTCLRFFLEEYERLDQPVLHDPDGRFLHYVQRQPLGVVVGFLAWNFPLLNVGYKIGPALAAGCSVIIKPSSFTPLASYEVAYLAKDAGIPDGVINMITAADHSVTNVLLESDVPELVTMIGSTRGGLEVMNASCTSVKHFSVELGGNGPVLVYPDSDVEAAANKIVDLKFANTGQVCVSPNRCFVHESVHDEFVAFAKKRAADVTMGPLITDKERQRVLGLVESAKADGAEIVCGGTAVDGPGYFMEPTILSNVKRKMRLSCEEIFGPVLPILSFSDADDEIALANDTEFGLAAYVFTKDLKKALTAARDIKAGSVCVNEPHYSIQLPHGGLKQSGVGKDCSRYSLQEYLTLKRVSVLIGD